MFRILHLIRTGSLAAMIAVLVGFGAMSMNAGVTLIVDHPAQAQQEGSVPGNVQGIRSDADLWRAIGQQEIVGQVSIPDKAAGRLVQRGGENWRAFKNGASTVCASST